MRRILALADDLTGALEVGAKFAGEGFASIVTTDAATPSDEAVLVVDTQTRHLSPQLAAARITEVLRETNSPDLSLIFKKTDSTLRGNITAELEALARFYNMPVIFAPAYPAMGRTVKDGILYVNGVPLAETSFANDPLNPINDSRVPTGPFCEMFEDVDEAATRIFSLPDFALAAGTGALAGALANLTKLPRNLPMRFPIVKRCLIVNGSLHQASTQQIANFTHRNWTVLHWTPADGRTPLEIAEDNGFSTLRALRDSAYDGVLICGGDTAYGMLKAAGFPPIRPIGDVVTGVPISRITVDGRELYLITKAGGFGGMDILREIAKRLHGDE